jgi:hypothetical protein
MLPCRRSETNTTRRRLKRSLSFSIWLLHRLMIDRVPLEHFDGNGTAVPDP